MRRMGDVRALLWASVIGIGVIVSPGLSMAEESTEQRFQRVEEEMKQLRLEVRNGTPEEGGELGQRLSFHGYGELHYNDPRGSTVPKGSDVAQMDFHRMVWGLGYHFNDRISLHTEVDFEHAARELELEYAFLDFLINQAVNVRAGAMLMPVG